MKGVSRSGWSRRQWLAAAGLAGAAGLVRGQSDAATLVFRYRTHPERIARMLPPPLEAAAEPLVHLEAGPAGARVLVACRHGETAGWLPVELRLPTDDARIVAREKLHLNARPGRVDVSASGERSTAGVMEGERTVFRLGAAFSGEPQAVPSAGPLFTFNAPLAADWTAGVLADETVDLVRVDLPDAERTGRAGSGAQLDWPDASPLTPGVEFPVVEPVGVWRVDAALALEPRKLAPATLASADAESFRPWSLISYERPITTDVAWAPEGWREQATAFKLTTDELSRYEERKEIIAGPLEIAEIDVMVSQEAHEAMLPPPCRGVGRPMLRVLGVRARGGDWSLQPYTEIWLLAFTIVASRAAWYAVSHIVSEGGDATLGRETFGYPTKTGEPDLVVTPVDFALSGRRQGHEFFYADGSFAGGFATGISLAELPLACLRVRGGVGEIVYQPCFYQGRRQRVDPRTLRVELPDGSPDPWHELGALRPGAVSVMDGAAMQRGPGEVIAEVPDFERYYRERCDGPLPWEPAGERKPSLLAGRDGASS